MPEHSDNKRGRTIAIGDIHGCSAALERLIREIDPRREDVVITLGDYADRGPDTRGVIDQLLMLPKRCEVVSLLGNHERMMLDALEACEQGVCVSEFDIWMHCGGDETIASYGGLMGIPQNHIAFLRRCRRFHETPTHAFVHANYSAQLPFDAQPEYTLLWEHISRRVPKPHTSGKTVVVGHTPQPDGEILNLGHLICIDTYCFGHGCLTALDVESGQIWQSDKAGNLRAG